MCDARRGLTAFFWAATALMAQVSGRVTGTVVDPSGAAVANAKVGLLFAGGKVPVLATLTNSAGIYDFTGVRSEVYTLEIEAQGFNKHTETEIRVDPAHELQLPAIALTIAAAVESVDVTTRAATVDLSSAEVSNTVTQAQITNLPVFDRQITNLFNTQAGFTTNNRTASTINGTRGSFSNTTVDGVLAQDVLRINDLDLVVNNPTIAQVAEFTVSTTNANPSLGGAASTIVITTPSGTNDLHGSGYWYNRNSYFAANDWFNNKNAVTRPQLDLNELGGTVGGPIVKDKLFYFGAYEAYRLKQQSPVTNVIPTPTARQGILQYPAGGGIQQFNVLRPFNLPASPLITSYLSKIPTLGNNNAVGDGLNTTGYTYNSRADLSANNVTAKGDYNLSPRHVFSASYNFSGQLQDLPNMGSSYTVVPPTYLDVNSTLVSGAWRWNPKPTLTNELRGGFTYNNVPFLRRQSDPAYVVAGLFFTSPIPTQQFGIGRNFRQYNLQDNAQWLHGRHTVSFGFQTAQLRAHFWNYNGVLPTYIVGLSGGSPYGFNLGDIPGATSTYINAANGILASIAGLVGAGQQSFHVTSPSSGFVPGAPLLSNQSFNQYALYAVDSFKVRRNLTLTLGLRWDYFLPVDETDGLAVAPRLINNNATATLLGNATLDFAGSTVGSPFYKKNLRNFAPNVSLAWDPFGNGKTSIRSGFNMAYVNDNYIGSMGTMVQTNNGLNITRQLQNLNAIVDNVPVIPTPPPGLPTTTVDQFKLSQSAPPSEALYNPQLKTPYIEQWMFSVQREAKGWVFEGRYVGNHAVQMMRLIDLNQVNIQQGGLLADFDRARSNGFAATSAGRPFSPVYNPAIPGSQPLTFLNQLPAVTLTNAALVGLIRTGEVGTFAQAVQSLFPYPQLGFSFFPNPYLTSALEMTNLSNATYNGLQLEVRKRTRSGFQFQANYTFGKALTDSDQLRGFDPQIDNASHAVERARADYDLTHAFKFNHYIPLPIGTGHRISSTSPALKRIVDGWALSGFGVLQTGSPVSILSARGTINRVGLSALNTVDTTATLSQLHQDTGLFMTGNGPYWIDPAHIGSDGRGVAADGTAPFSGQIFFNPQPGTQGSLQKRALDGPPFRNYNFAVVKNFKITERQTIDFHADFFNLFNHPNFIIPGDFNVNSPSFGKITNDTPTCTCSATGVGPRVIQYGLYYRF